MGSEPRHRADGQVRRQVHGVVEQILLFQLGGPGVGVVRVLLGDDQVEVAGLQRGKGRFRFGLRDVDPQAGMDVAQETQRVRPTMRRAAACLMWRGSAVGAGDTCPRGARVGVGAGS